MIIKDKIIPIIGTQTAIKIPYVSFLSLLISRTITPIRSNNPKTENEAI